jgi:hypothetical protein
MLTIIDRMKAARKAVRHAIHFESIVVPDNEEKQDVNCIGITSPC